VWQPKGLRGEEEIVSSGDTKSGKKEDKAGFGSGLDEHEARQHVSLTKS